MRLASRALDDIRRPGGLELAVVVLAAVVLAGVAIAGGSQAADDGVVSGLAIGVDSATAGPSKTTVLTVTVANGSPDPFRGALRASVAGNEARASVDLSPGGSTSERLSVAAPCGTPVTLILEGPDGPLRHATATAPCDGRASR